MQQPRPARPPRLVVIEGQRDTPPETRLSPTAYGVAICFAVALGALVRASFVLSQDFPLSDGGLFFVMAEDLQHSGYALPAFTSYNASDIPFAYPPLGIYAGALVADLTPLDMLQTLRILPLTASVLSILAFHLLARSLIRSQLAVVVSVFAFALLPRAFYWMIMGGGLTRSFGLLFALLALHQVVVMCRSGGARHAIAAGVFAGLTALSHLEWAWFVAFSTPILIAGHGLRREHLRDACIAGVVAVALAAPWWGTVIAQHGLSPFLAASQTASQTSANPLVSLLSFHFTDEPLFPLLATLGLIGLIAEVAGRRYLLPGWFLACLVLEPTAFGTVAMVPLALLVACGVTGVMLPMLEGPARSEHPGRILPPRWLPAAAAVAAVFYTLLSAALTSPKTLSAMTSDERDAMAWAAANTPSSSRFLVVTGDRWAIDRTSEWFPALTGRVSVATPQGYEFVPGRALEQKIEAYIAAQRCASSDAGCLDAWRARFGEAYAFDYIYLPRLEPRNFSTLDKDECCAALRAALLRDPGYRTVFDGPGATIISVRPKDAN
ncbi:MAG: hypothetical protein WEC75_12920 [Dehalococcoidia bacterium]